jgi:hypothetical protein
VTWALVIIGKDNTKKIIQIAHCFIVPALKYFVNNITTPILFQGRSIGKQLLFDDESHVKSDGRCWSKILPEKQLTDLTSVPHEHEIPLPLRVIQMTYLTNCLVSNAAGEDFHDLE